MLTLIGCATIELGRNIDLSQIDQQLKIGKTTQEELRQLLGPPLAMGVEHRPQLLLEEWTYYSGSGKLPSLKHARLQILQIRFTHEGIVESYNWTE